MGPKPPRCLHVLLVYRRSSTSPSRVLRRATTRSGSPTGSSLPSSPSSSTLLISSPLGRLRCQAERNREGLHRQLGLRADAFGFLKETIFSRNCQSNAPAFLRTF